MRGSFYSRNWRGAFVYMAMFLFALTLNLRAQVTTSAISGMVKDNNGTPLPGVNIIAVHEPSGTKAGAYSRSDGRFNLPGMRVGGPYTVTASMIGYKEHKIENINLALGEEKNLTFVLVEEAVEMEGSEIVAERNPIINDARTGAATTVNELQVKYLPAVTRDFNDFTKYTPQFSGNSAAGRNNRYNNISIDGAVSNDLFGLAASGTPGGQAGTAPISLDAIQEFQVQIAPYDVRLGNFTGGNVNAITRSGTNKFEFSSYYNYRNENFQGESFDGVLPTKNFIRTEGARLGGPIIKDKMFFFVNYDHELQEVPTNYGILGDGSSLDFPGTGSRLSVKKARDIQNFLKDTVLHDPGSFGMSTIPTESYKFFARLDFNLTPEHRFTIRHNYINANQDLFRRETGTNSSSSSGGFRFSNSRYIFKNITNSTVAQLNSTLSKEMFNELTMSYQVIDDHRETPGDRFPYVMIRDSVAGLSYVIGTEQFSQFNKLKQSVFEFTDNFTYYMGEHTFTIGTHNEYFKFENGFLPSFNGRYDFNSFENFKRSYYGLTGNIREYNLTFALDPNDPTGFNADTTDRVPLAKFSVMQLGGYIQDAFKVTPSLTITAGLRFDVPIISDKPTANDSFAINYARFYHTGGENDTTIKNAKYRTDKIASGNILWSPRIGWNWDVNGDQSLQFRGGFGIFSGRNPYVWISNQYSNTGADLGTIRLTGGSTLTNMTFQKDPTKQPTAGTLGSSTINVMNPKFKNPQVFRVNLALDQKLSDTWVGTVEFVGSDNINDVMFKDISLAGPQSYSPTDNRPRFGTISTYTSPSSSATTSPARVLPLSKSKQYTNVIYLTNTKWGYQWNASVQLQKLYDNGYFGSVAYTYGRATDMTSATSSIALSNFQFNPVKGDPNNVKTATSNYEQRHRIIVSVAKEIEVAPKWKTVFSLFYSGFSGRPYSTTYNGDVNADGNTGNDLIYVPKDKNDIVLVPTSNSDTRSADQIWVELDEFISGDPALRKARGKIVDRNASTEPWTNRVDFQITQELPVLKELGKFELTANVINVMNIFDNEWGQSKSIANQNDQAIQFRGIQSGTGKPVFSFTKRPDRYSISTTASRWAVLVGARYSF